MPLQIVHHPDYDAGFAVNHRFPMSKYPLLMEALHAARPGRRRGAHRCPSRRRPTWLKLAHAADYVDQVIACAVPEKIEREIGFPVGPRVSLRAQLAAGGTVLAARLALQPRHRLQHRRRQPSCAARARRRLLHLQRCRRRFAGAARRRRGAKHPGRRSRRASGRRHRGHPGRRAARRSPSPCMASATTPCARSPPISTSRCPTAPAMPPISSGWRDILPELSAKARWDIVFYNAGVDVHAEDRLGRLALSDDGLRARDTMVIGHFRALGIPVCGVIGGGYSTDVRSTCRAPRHPVRGGVGLRLRRVTSGSWRACSRMKAGMTIAAPSRI